VAEVIASDEAPGVWLILRSPLDEGDDAGFQITDSDDD
jgi:hypothetical protein